MSGKPASIFASAALVCMIASQAAANAESKGQPPKGPRDVTTRQAKAKTKGQDRKLGALLKSLDTSEQTQQQVRDALTEYRKQSVAWRKEHQDQQRELSKQLARARQAKNAQAVEQIKGKMRRLNESRAELKESTLESLSELLDEDEMTKVRRHLGVDRIRRQSDPTTRVMARLRGLELTGQQRKKARAILQDAYLEAVSKALGKVKSDVLTDVQAERLNVEEVLRSLRPAPTRPEDNRISGTDKPRRVDAPTTGASDAADSSGSGG